MDYFYKLIIRSSKFSFFLSFVFMAPIALQIDFVLSVWLKIVPDYAGIFCQLNVVNTFLWIAFWPIGHGITSTGRNETFRKIDSLMTMFIFPVAYFGLHFSPIGYVCSYIFVNIFRMTYWLLTFRKLTNFSIRIFISQSLLKCLAVGAISIPLPLYITLNISGWQGFLICLAVFFVIFVLSILFIGLNRNERKEVMKWMMGKLTIHLCH
jgi:hypothetical protein